MLGEPTGRWRWGAVLVGFLGVLVIVQPGSGHIGGWGGLVALGAVVTTASATIAIRHLGATEAVATTVFWFGFDFARPARPRHAVRRACRTMPTPSP